MAATDMVASIATNGAELSTGKKDNYEMPPSRVIHCRAVAKGCKETDLVSVMKLFGNIKALKLMPQICQALVEFEDLESAIASVTYSHIQPIIVIGRQMYVNYSKSSEINRNFDTSVQIQPPSNVLLLTIVNVIYPVTVDIIKTICEQQNVEVQRIAIFHKNGLQAFVEFKSIDDANHILQKINGCDIYPGCCTLKIDYSKATKLNVRSNTDESFNIEIPTGWDDQYNQASNHLSDVNIDPNISDLLANAAGFPAVQSILEKAMTGRHPNPNLDSNQANYLEDYTSPFSTGKNSNGGPGCVAMVFGLNNAIMNCDHLFNLFCLYGNVVKVKILVNKPNCAMVQYSERLSTELAIQNLNNMTLFGIQFRVAISKHSYILGGSETTPLFDGTPSSKSFIESRDNRFKPTKNGRNNLFSHIHPPSKVLHYFNCPPDCTEERLTQLFSSSNAGIPSKQASISRPGGKSSSGLLEFSSISAAAEALILVNHSPLNREDIENSTEKTSSPFIFKLAFSSSQVINKTQ